MGDKIAYSIGEAAAALGIGKTSLYELIKAGKLTPQPLAGGVVDKRVIPRAQLEALLATDSPPRPASKHAA